MREHGGGLLRPLREGRQAEIHKGVSGYISESERKIINETNGLEGRRRQSKQETRTYIF